MAADYPPIGLVRYSASGKRTPVKPECQHTRRVPVDSEILHAPVAELCLTCDKQLPVPWPKETQ